MRERERERGESVCVLRNTREWESELQKRPVCMKRELICYRRDLCV